MRSLSLCNCVSAHMHARMGVRMRVGWWRVENRSPSLSGSLAVTCTREPVPNCVSQKVILSSISSFFTLVSLGDGLCVAPQSPLTCGACQSSRNPNHDHPRASARSCCAQMPSGRASATLWKIRLVWVCPWGVLHKTSGKSMALKKKKTVAVMLRKEAKKKTTERGLCPVSQLRSCSPPSEKRQGSPRTKTQRLRRFNQKALTHLWHIRTTWPNPNKLSSLRILHVSS